VQYFSINRCAVLLNRKNVQYFLIGGHAVLLNRWICSTS
jgi:hypothetical protein